MKKAPWKDFEGNDIYEQDIIVHPSGESGVVTFLEYEKTPEDQWKVVYPDGPISRLCLQIGDKGMAVVMKNITE